MTEILNTGLADNSIGLAPMEGLIDHPLREILTAQGGYDYCVTEFIRVVDVLIPEKVFLRSCPELNQNGKTLAGTPVHVQLLGSDLNAMAENACRAVELGAPAISLNFGCPAKGTNIRQGGAVLLKEPTRIHNIVSAVKKVLPNGTLLTAKMRLGYEDHSLVMENALAIESAGAHNLTVHARTKLQGYKPPAHWHLIKPISHALHIPVIANGDIFNPMDYQNCQTLSGCQHVMIGRGAVSQPDLARHIIDDTHTPLDWPELQTLLLNYLDQLLQLTAQKYAVARFKQWLNYVSKVYPEAQIHFEKIKRVKQVQAIWQHFKMPH
jgi:tRNA-dihydrouridine synthase C